MLRSTIHLPPIEEGEFLLCYVKYAVLLILDEPIITKALLSLAM